jgi:nitrite reductase (NADH) large subunit
VLCKAHTTAILGSDHAEAVLLEDGAAIGADLVVMAAGIRPETRLAVEAGLRVERGIWVDDQLRTTDPDIMALGECVEHAEVVYGLVAPLFDMARVLARTLVGEAAAFAAPVVSTKLKVTGVDLFSVGDFGEGEGREEIVFRDPARGIYKRLILRENRIIGIVMYGDTLDSGWFFDKLKAGEDISDIRETLIFGPAYQGGALPDPLAVVAAMPMSAEICGCNGVCKGTIVEAIQGGATTLGAVKAATKASASCGTCAGLVEQVLACTLGDAFAAPAQAGICGCTDHSHEDIRRVIKAQSLKSIPAVMQEMGWKTSCGCHICRPALNYYLICQWPLDYVDDQQSRFVNERNHANIQKDGTYSVIPRVWGGDTDADYLIRMGEVAKKYNVKTIKITGGQRIGLYGIKKEDLLSVWKDLDMPSGFAYGKALRTVKTCVGSEWCRFGTQDSTSLGIRLEKTFDRTWYPAKTKLAASGCPRNCAEATIKDLGVVGVEGGWELYVGGNGGVKVRAGDLLCMVKTDDEVVEITKAYLQYYRETGKHNERTAPWLERIGLEKIKQVVVDSLDSRRELVERMDIYLSTLTTDPWRDRLEDQQKSASMPQFNEYKTIDIPVVEEVMT